MHEATQFSPFFAIWIQELAVAVSIDSDECTQCGECKTVCPTGSIRRQDGVYQVNPETCDECLDLGDDDPRCITACPVDFCISF